MKGDYRVYNWLTQELTPQTFYNEEDAQRQATFLGEVYYEVRKIVSLYIDYAFCDNPASIPEDRQHVILSNSKENAHKEVAMKVDEYWSARRAKSIELSFGELKAKLTREQSRDCFYETMRKFVEDVFNATQSTN